MRLYHSTTADAADDILANGFRDRTGTYLTEVELSGVWLSDVPLDLNEGADGDTLLAVDLDLSEDELADYEWVEEGKSYREWCVSAKLIAAFGAIRRVMEEDQLIDRRFAVTGTGEAQK